MQPQILERLVTEFNARHYREAAAAAHEGALLAGGGRDERFWSGLQDTCTGYALLMDKKLGQAEAKLASAIESLRNFGFLYQNVEVTSVLAGLRRGVEEIRAVRGKQKSAFDMTLLPNIRMAARAENDR